MCTSFAKSRVFLIVCVQFFLLSTSVLNADELIVNALQPVESLLGTLQQEDDKKEEDSVDKEESDDKQEEKKPNLLVYKRYSRADMIKKMSAYNRSRLTNMWGDFFDGTPQRLQVVNGINIPDSWGVQPSSSDGAVFEVPRLGGLSARRIKLAENTSPIPTDRWIFNYNRFNNVIGLGDITRYTFGIEKTFDDGLKSLEVRFPFAHTLASEQTLVTVANSQANVDSVTKRFRDEPGNLTLTYKTVIRPIDDGIVTAGLGIALPTSHDPKLFSDHSQPKLLLHVKHDSVNLLPFIGFIKRPSERTFVQGIIQADFPTDSSEVLALGGGLNPTLESAAEIEPVPLLFFDLGFGYRLTEPENKNITQITAFGELHYSLGMSDQERFEVNPQGPLNGAFNLIGGDRIGALNLTAGLSFAINDTMSIRPAVSVPLNDNDANMYDYEFGVQLSILR